jgi:hypothetical protein
MEFSRVIFLSVAALDSIRSVLLMDANPVTGHDTCAAESLWDSCVILPQSGSWESPLEHQLCVTNGC